LHWSGGFIRIRAQTALSDEAARIAARLEQFQKFCSRYKNLKQPNCAPASWTAAALCRYCIVGLRWKSGRRLPQSKTSRKFPAGFQNPATVLIKPLQPELRSCRQHVAATPRRRKGVCDAHVAFF
jgi:hypothetical protein